MPRGVALLQHAGQQRQLRGHVSRPCRVRQRDLGNMPRGVALLQHAGQQRQLRGHRLQALKCQPTGLRD